MTAKVADFGLSRLAPVQDDEGVLPNHVSTIVKGTPVNLAHCREKMFSVMDSTMGPYPSECVEKFVALALKCCEDKPEDRPSMLDVVRELETIESIFNMMPDADADTVDSKAKFNEPKSSSSFSDSTSRDPFLSSNVSEVYSISGVSLTMPR
ncbi:hypothetical protein HAX54_023105 [Datura stramonium]|uniref:Uncharacterized protein n=1 Tax=Datura stramonium TaxID=4076 RepID=A0ABS8RJX4_DATST|nr:hypothetical protein [Datura stramonium]